MAHAQRLLLIDDDARLTGMVGDYLRNAGYEVDAAGSLAAGRERLRNGQYDALLLDLMLPDGDGLDLTRELRADARTRRLPLLMLTARGEPLDRIVGLEIGADDYLGKPFEPRELLARVKALLRRAQPDIAADEVLRFGRLEIDLGARQARLDAKSCDLTDAPVRAARGAGPGRRPRALARPDHGRAARPPAGSLRPLDRRAHLAHPRRHRRRPEGPEARAHGARRRLPVREAPGRRRRRDEVALPAHLPDGGGGAGAVCRRLGVAVPARSAGRARPLRRAGQRAHRRLGRSDPALAAAGRRRARAAGDRAGRVVAAAAPAAGAGRRAGPAHRCQRVVPAPHRRDAWRTARPAGAPGRRPHAVAVARADAGHARRRLGAAWRRPARPQRRAAVAAVAARRRAGGLAAAAVRRPWPRAPTRWCGA